MHDDMTATALGPAAAGRNPRGPCSGAAVVADPVFREAERLAEKLVVDPAPPHRADGILRDCGDTLAAALADTGMRMVGDIMYAPGWSTAATATLHLLAAQRWTTSTWPPSSSVGC